MSKVLTFSRTFPAHHPKAGQPTHFVEKFWKSLYDQDKGKFLVDMLSYEAQYQDAFPATFSREENINNHAGKHHTIRAGSRLKIGDKFSPRVWSGKPYNSKQIIIAPDTEVKKVWDFKLHGGNCFTSWKQYLNDEDLNKIALNDGLTLDELVGWFWNFSKQFDGQIICWNESVNY